MTIIIRQTLNHVDSLWLKAEHKTLFKQLNLILKGQTLPPQAPRWCFAVGHSTVTPQINVKKHLYTWNSGEPGTRFA